MTDPADLQAVELLAAYRDRTLSPVEATSAVLARIARLDPRVNAFCLVDEAAALTAARASEDRWARGEPCGALDGVPVSIKDLLLTRGWPTLRGSHSIDAAGPWDVDAPSVARVREQGGVLVGKTTTPELGWKGVTDAPRTGVTGNPWDPTPHVGGLLGRQRGGRRAGHGAALARHRRRRLGAHPRGLLRRHHDQAHVGSGADLPAEPVRAAVARRADDPHGGRRRPAARRGVRRRRPRRLGAGPGRARPRRRSTRRWRACGWRRARRSGTSTSTRGWRRRSSRPSTCSSRWGCASTRSTRASPTPIAAFEALWFSGAAASLAALPAHVQADMDRGLVDVAAEGARIGAVGYLKAMAVRGDLGVRMGEFHERYDLLVTPTLPITAFEAGVEVPPGWPRERWTSWTPFTYPFNMTQQPAASVPCGLVNGLPVGLQIVGPRHADGRVLALAHAFQQCTDWHRHRPPLL